MTKQAFNQLKRLAFGHRPSGKEQIVRSREYYESVFQKTLDFPSYAELAGRIPVLGIWDDHDFGKDNAGSDFLGKDLTREIFLNFLKEPADSERRLQNGTAIFQDYFITKVVAGKHIDLHLILLDNRYSYDKRTKNLLGEAQWQWLD